MDNVQKNNEKTRHSKSILEFMISINEFMDVDGVNSNHRIKISKKKK